MDVRALRRRDVLTLAGAAAVARPVVAAAQVSSSWPTGNLTIVSPFTPGGMTDILARAIAERLGPIFSRTVLVDNRPGAAGAIGSTAVARSAPEGQTLLIGHIGTLGVNPSLYPKLPYDPLTSFVYVAPLALVPNVLVVNPTVPAHSVSELIAYAKANPGKLNYSSAGQGSAAHIAMAAFNLAADTSMLHVPYRGTPPAIADLLAGQVQLAMTGVLSLLPHVRSGGLRALGVSTRKRLSIAPDIPAIAETLPDFEASPWYGIVAPAGTPAAIVERLHREIRTIMVSPEITQRLTAEGSEFWDISPDEFRRFVAAEIPRWKAVIEAAKIQVE